MLNYGEYKPEEIAELSSTVKTMCGTLEREFATNSSTVLFQEYKEQESDNDKIDHFHVHIVPRQPKDLPRVDDIYPLLFNHDKEYVK